MTETPREYKKRIDEKWKRNEKNKERLIKKIEGYELLDKGFKEQTKKEILANFEKNQKADLEGEQYKMIVSELGKIDKKYEELEVLRKELSSKKIEIIHIENEIRKCKFDGVDETTLKMQMLGVNKLKEKLKAAKERIGEIDNEIKNREQEIKEIEEAYGRKSLYEDNDNNSAENIENEIDNQHSNIVGKPETLEKFHKQTIKELWNKDKTRKDIIKILDDGTGIDDSLSEKIRKELYDKFFEYYDEKQGNLRMKSARFIKNINREYKHIYGTTYKCEIGGKPVFEAYRNGRKCIIRGNEQIGLGFDYLYDIKEIGGKPCAIVHKDGKQYVMLGKEQYSDKFDLVYDIKEIGGKPCFRVQNNGKQCVIWGKEEYSDWFDSLNEPIKVGGKPCYLAEKDGKRCIMWGKEQYSDFFDVVIRLQEIGGKPCFQAKKDGKRCIMWGKEQYSDFFDVVIRLQEIGGKPCFQAKKDGKWCVMWGAEQYGEWYDEVQDLKEIGGKPSFKAEKNGRWEEYNNEINNITGTPREIREILILQWYRKKLNRDKLFEFIGGISALDKKSKLNLKKEILSDFYLNYENARENAEFKNADEQYRELKKSEAQQKKQLKENGEYEEKTKKDINRIEKELLEITEIAMKLEDGSFWKKRKLEKTIVRRDELESQRMKLKGDILKLERGKAEIEGNFKDELKKYGPEIDRTVGKNHNIEITGYQPHEFGPTLKLYKQDYYQTVKEKEKYYEKILDKFKYLDFGISEELKNKTMMQLEEVMKSEIENLKLGDETVKLADETEKWLEDNRINVLEKLYNLKGKIEEKENEKIMLKAKKDGANPDEVKKISDQELELEKSLSEFKSEFQSIKDELYRKLKEYDGTEFDRGKIFDVNFYEIDKELIELKSETTLLGYKERYKKIIEIKEKYLDEQFKQIKTMHLGISQEKSKEVFDLIKSHMDEEFNKFKSGDEMIKLTEETEKWLEDNRKKIIERINELNGKIQPKEKQLKDLEEREESASGDELLQIKEEEFEVKKELIDLKNEYESLKTEIEDKAKRFNGRVIDRTKEVKVETWKEMNEREKRETQIKLTKEKYKKELDTIRSEQQKEWSDEYHKYPHGRCALSESSRAAIECGDKACLVMLFDCESDVDSTNSYSDPEQSKILYIKCGESKIYKKFVRRHATDADLDNKSVAYNIITDIKFDGELLQIWLSRGEGWQSVRYEFKIK